MATKLSLAKAAAKGDHLETLIALRDDLSSRMEITDSDQNYSVMSRVLTDVLDKIAKLEGLAKGAKGTAVDELSKRRAAAGRPDASNLTGAVRSQVGS